MTSRMPSLFDSSRTSATSFSRPTFASSAIFSAPRALFTWDGSAVTTTGVGRLAQVVWRLVRGHADRVAARSVDQQVREARRQDGRLLLVPVEVRDEVDGLGLDVAEELHRHRR